MQRAWINDHSLGGSFVQEEIYPGDLSLPIAKDMLFFALYPAAHLLLYLPSVV